MTSTVEVRAIRDLTDKLWIGVHRLVRGTVVDMKRDDGSEIGLGPSLLVQLRASISNKASGVYGGSGAVRGVPIDLDALDLYNEIRRDWGHEPLETAFVNVARGIALGHHTVDEVTTLVFAVLAVAHRIDDLLNPPRRFKVAAPCPECGQRMAYRRDFSGDLVQVPALAVDGVTGCRCLVCGTVWPPSLLVHLGRVLGCASLESC